MSAARERRKKEAKSWKMKFMKEKCSGIKHADASSATMENFRARGCANILTRRNLVFRSMCFHSVAVYIYCERINYFRFVTTQEKKSLDEEKSELQSLYFDLYVYFENYLPSMYR